MPGDWIARYLDGATLDEVAPLASLSKQGAADRLRSLGIHVRSAVETRALREQRVIAEKGDDIRAAFLRTRDLASTADEMGLTPTVARRAIVALVPDYRVLAKSPRPSMKRYSDEDLIGSLVEAAATGDRNLTTAAYDRFTHDSPTLADGRPRPGHQAMLLRFDSWRGALSAAHLPANPHGGPPKQFEDSSAAVASIVACWRDTGAPPTVASYDQWQRGKDGHPSSALARRLVGGSWDVGLVHAWQVVHETPLAADDPDRVARVLVDPGTTTAFASYSPADESVAVQGSLEMTLPNYLALERAVRSHARIQNLVAAAIVSSGFKPLSPALAFPQFDVAFEGKGRTVVVEVKSCTADNAELQLRLGLGQVLRYRSQMDATATAQVSAVLAVEVDPGRDWRSLLDELGVGLLVEATMIEDMSDLVIGWKLVPS